MSVLSIAASGLLNYLTQQQNSAKSTQNTTSQTSNPIAQAFSRLSQDLQSGDLSAAQQDYATIQQDFQSMATQSQAMRTHHHHHVGDSGGSRAVSQLFSELGSALQSGNLTNAQQAYSSLQQDLLQLTQGVGVSSGSTPAASTTSGSLSVNG